MFNQRNATSPHRTAMVVVLAATLVSALGCATPVYRRDHGPIVGSQGGAYDTVLPGPKSALADAGWELARNDGALNQLTGSEMLQRYAFPTLSAPTLDRQRYINLSHSSRRMIYFDRPRRGVPVYP